MAWFKKLDPTARSMLVSLGVVLGALAVLGLLVITLVWRFEGPAQWLLGLALGGAASAGKILLMERSMSRALDMQPASAPNFARLHSLLRFFLSVGVILLAVLLRRQVGLIGTFAGILALQLAAVGATLHIRRQDRGKPLPPPLPPEEEGEDEDDGRSDIEKMVL